MNLLKESSRGFTSVQDVRNLLQELLDTIPDKALSKMLQEVLFSSISGLKSWTAVCEIIREYYPQAYASRDAQYRKEWDALVKSVEKQFEEEQSLTHEEKWNAYEKLLKLKTKLDENSPLLPEVTDYINALYDKYIRR